MPFTELGFELALDQLTDATNGINKVLIWSGLGTSPAPQDITFDAAVGTSTYGTVNMTSTDLVFSIGAGVVVTRVELYHGTDAIATYTFPTPYSFTNAGTFTLTDLQIRLE